MIMVSIEGVRFGKRVGFDGDWKGDGQVDGAIGLSQLFLDDLSSTASALVTICQRD